MKFFSRLLLCLATLALFPVLFISTRQVGLICFCIFKSSFLVFVQILYFDFRVVDSEYDEYLPVDHSVVCSQQKMFLLVQSNLECSLENLS